MILLYQLYFILGLRVCEISRLKFNNYYKKRSILIFLRDIKPINRALNCFTTECINIIEKESEFDKNCPLIFIKEKFLNSKTKELFLIGKLKKMINSS